MTKPSWQDFGTHDESIVPELWDGVVGAWAPCLGPTGSRLHDMSRRANWGTLTNMDNTTSWVVQDGQYTLDLDGVDDRVVGQYSPIFDLAITKSVVAWINARAFDSAIQSSDIVNTDSLGGGARTWQFNGYNGTGPQTDGALQVFSFGTGGGIRDIRTSEILGVNRWHHIAFTTPDRMATAAEIKIYVDGVQRATTDFGSGTFGFANTLQTANTLNFGRRPVIGADSHFNGRIDDIALWSRVLSANEIRQLYQLRRGGMYQRRRRSRIYIPQAGFQAAWARGSNVLLGFQQP